MKVQVYGYFLTLFIIRELIFNSNTATAGCGYSKVENYIKKTSYTPDSNQGPLKFASAELTLD